VNFNREEKIISNRKMKNLMKVLLFAALFAATFGKPLCSDNCGKDDETQNRIDVLKLNLEDLKIFWLNKLLSSFNPTSGANSTNLNGPILTATATKMLTDKQKECIEKRIPNCDQLTFPVVFYQTLRTYLP
jgi:hypothetical protein